ncbi:MAG: DUF302 domain-containing protein [Halomonas sp.]|uniref:DUF302 domain-containing protein n=1 Tax=Halomonas sp. TaxID=1486246 RepID=UPI003F90DDE3
MLKPLTYLALPFAMLFLPLSTYAHEAESSAHEASSGIMHRQASADIDTVTERLRTAIEGKGLTLMTVVDHTANAEKAEMTLPPTRLFIFGNPVAGTPMMQCQGSMALDLPQKMLVRETDAGVVVEWNSPHYLAERHGLAGCDIPLDKVSGLLDAVADEAATGSSS